MILKKIFFAWFLFSVFLCSCDQCSIIRSSEYLTLSLKNQDQTLIPFQRVLGKITIVHIWATWCKPCRKELPEFFRFSKKFQKKPVQFVLVSIDRDWKVVRSFLKKWNIPKKIILLLDPQKDFSQSLESKGGSVQVPETYFLNETGHVFSKWLGPQNWKEKVFQRLIEKKLQALKE